MEYPTNKTKPTIKNNRLARKKTLRMLKIEENFKLAQVKIYFNKQEISNILVLKSASVSWSYSGVSNNKLMHALNGNKNNGYKIAAWNCRRGLLKDGSPSEKVTDIEMYLQKHQLHMFGIIECDLHGPRSRINRRLPLSTKDIHEKLHIDGYSILLPQSWYTHDQARILIFVKDGIHLKERKLTCGDSDLQSISVELGLGREKKTCVNIFYREFTGGVSGLNSIGSQRERLCRQVSPWKSLYAGGRDVVILGDSNLCANQWENENYQRRELAIMVQDYLLEETSYQLVAGNTRSELVGGVAQISCIDHCYSNVREKITGLYIESIGNSDHLGVRILKYSSY